MRSTQSVAPNLAYRMLALMTGAQVGGAVVQQGLGSLSPALIATFALNKAQLGAAFTAISVGSAVFTVGAGIAVDRFGERPVIYWGGLSLGASLFLAAAIPSYPWLVFWLFVMGVAYASQTPAGGRAILAWFTTNRGFAMSIRQAGVPLGGALGAALLPAIAAWATYRWSLVAAGVIGAGSAMIAANYYVDAPRAPRAPKAARALLAGMWRAARTPRTMLFTVACMVLSSAQTIVNAFFTVTAIDVERVTPATAALAFAFAQVCAMVGRIVWGRLSDGVFRGDRALPLATIALIVAIDAFAIAHTGASHGAVTFLLAGLLGASAAGWNGVFATAMAEIGGAEFAGSVLGLGLTFVFGAGAVAPLVFGAVADRYGLGTAWTGLGVLCAAGIVPPLASRAFANGRV